MCCCTPIYSVKFKEYPRISPSSVIKSSWYTYKVLLTLGQQYSYLENDNNEMQRYTQRNNTYTIIHTQFNPAWACHFIFPHHFHLIPKWMTHNLVFSSGCACSLLKVIPNQVLTTIPPLTVWNKNIGKEMLITHYPNWLHACGYILSLNIFYPLGGFRKNHLSFQTTQRPVVP